MQNRNVLIGAGIVVIVIIAGAWALSRPPTPNPTDTTLNTITTATSTPATTTPAKPAPIVVAKKTTLPLSNKDKVVSWSFKGTAQDGGTLEAKANTQIASLKAQVNEKNETVQETYISIALEYMLLGNGTSAYDYFLKALNSNKRYEQEDALAWAGLGGLMEKLGAYNTAAVAFANATASEPYEPTFHVSRISFLLEHFGSDTKQINAAFADADRNIPGDKSVAQLKAQYQNSL